MTGTPAAASAAAVPPVDRISTPARRRAARQLDEAALVGDARAALAGLGHAARLLPPDRAASTQLGARTRPSGRRAAAAPSSSGDGDRHLQLEQAADLDLADALAGQVHDLADLLERDAAALGDVERAGVASCSHGSRSGKLILIDPVSGLTSR